MAEFPSMPLWTDAYLADTTHLTTIEHGAFLLLLMTMWRAKGNTLPDDDRLLAKYARLTAGQWRRIRPVMEPLFRVDDGIWSNSRLMDEVEAVRQLSARQSDAAKARWLKEKRKHRANAMPRHCHGNAPTPIPIKEKPISKDMVKKKAHKRGSRISPDWHLPDDWRQWATEFGMPLAMVEIEADSFRDYWIAKPGQHGVKIDWMATWRNWCRKAMERRPKPNGGSHGKSRAQRQFDLAADMAREADRRQAGEQDLDFGTG